MAISLLQLASDRLGYLSDVQNLLAGNLANIDTPNYRPSQIVSFSDYLGNSSGQTRMLQNDPQDIPGLTDASAVGTTGATGATGGASASAEHSPDGNAVSLDQQLVAISKNETDQQFTANLYQSYMGMFKAALGSTG
jgi:flagellar basal-body rod protein FlgB